MRKFTKQQVEFICYQIGEWYVQWKNQLVDYENRTHRLGYAKRKYDAGDAYWQNVYPAIFTPENEMRYRRAISFLQKFNQVNNTNFTIDQLLNAYALAHKRADFLTVGPVSVEQVKRTINALPLSKHLTTQDLDYLNKVDASPAVLSCKEIYSSH
jgi:aryl-alcohol dehydrogenase-like predicted oxidoreductase